MASTLLLMRHGKAKAIAPDQEDFDRELTEAGKRSLAAKLPYMLSHLSDQKASVQIWSSPALRTMQTASILAKALRSIGVKVSGDTVELDALWEQDETRFVDTVKNCDAEMVIAIGHNPMIESLTLQLTGARIPFATGAVAALQLNWDDPIGQSELPQTENEYKHRLLWFSQGPISQHWRTIVQMEKMIRSAAYAVFDRLDAFFLEPDDIETMHKFRVSIRTLRSLVAFVKPWQEAKQNASMQSELKEVVGLTSRLRELDVLAEQAAESESASMMLKSFLDDKASVERVSVYESLQAKRVRKSLERVRGEAEDIRWKRQYLEDGLPVWQVRERFDKMAAELESDLSALDLADVEPTHDVRKSAKRVRYAAENFKGLIGDDVIGVAKGMTAHQDDLGAVCDARVNIDIINALLDSGEAPEQVAWELALLRAQNETYLYTTLRDRHSDIK